MQCNNDKEGKTLNLQKKKRKNNSEINYKRQFYSQYNFYHQLLTQNYGTIGSKSFKIL